MKTVETVAGALVASYVCEQGHVPEKDCRKLRAELIAALRTDLAGKGRPDLGEWTDERVDALGCVDLPSGDFGPDPVFSRRWPTVSQVLNRWSS